MAKYPEPGRVKTRLAARIGPAAAAELQAAFLADLAVRLSTLDLPVRWAVWPAGAPLRALVPGAVCVPQEGEDLGARMCNAATRLMTEARAPIVLLGADAPHAPLPAIRAAADALVGEADVVLGPADDGGYWLLGMAEVVPALFADVPWGTRTVLAVTRERTRRLGLRERLVESTFDVDAPEDLERLRGLIRRGEAVLPATARVLATIPPPPS